MVRFLFIQMEKRGHGTGRKLLSLLKERARDELGADRRKRRARSDNARALRCYVKNGFSTFCSEDTRLMMGKDLSPDRTSETQEIGTPRPGQHHALTEVPLIFTATPSTWERKKSTLARMKSASGIGTASNG